MKLTIPGTSIKDLPVDSYGNASIIYNTYRDISFDGASKFRNGKITDDQGKQIAFISFNSKVWAGTKYDPNATPIYIPIYRKEPS